MAVQIGEQYRFEQQVTFDGHVFGSDLSYPNGGEVQITRGSDNYFWNGSIFQATEQWLTTTVSSSGLSHYYDFTVPLTAVSGDTYNFKIRVFEDPDTEFVGNMLVRPEATGSGGGGGDATKVFDAVDFVTGFPSTVG